MNQFLSISEEGGWIGGPQMSLSRLCTLCFCYIGLVGVASKASHSFDNKCHLMTTKACFLQLWWGSISQSRTVLILQTFCSSFLKVASPLHLNISGSIYIPPLISLFFGSLFLPASNNSFGLEIWMPFEIFLVMSSIRSVSTILH